MLDVDTNTMLNKLVLDFIFKIVINKIEETTTYIEVGYLVSNCCRIPTFTVLWRLNHEIRLDVCWVHEGVRPWLWYQV